MTPVPMLLLAALVLAVDAGARRLGAYDRTDASWPAGWRAVPLDAQGPDGPYRANERWERVVAAGIPRATSLFVTPVLGLTLLWSFATVLALGDALEVMRGARALGPALASFFLCVTRAGIGFAVLGAAVGRATAHFAAWSAVALGLDLLLFTVPIPCSDHRSDDVSMAAFGLAAGLLLAGGFAWSVLRRKGLVARDPERLARMN